MITVSLGPDAVFTLTALAALGGCRKARHEHEYPCVREE